MKKESWTEHEIASFIFESDNFERKSGALLTDGDFDNALAKQLSAFANSEGGHIVIGVREDRTFDGVARVKGRTKIVEWLGQKIPDLVIPSLQNFRVHEVERAENSQIPEDKVVIVIDIDRSDLAPHQSATDAHYYTRIDKQSRPANHRYLELLFDREKFPGPKIAEAWVYRVINPLIYFLKSQARILAEESWGFDRSNTKRLKSLERIAQNELSGNHEQLLQHYNEINRRIREHDELVEGLVEALRVCHIFICESGTMQQIVGSVTSLDSLQKLRDEQLCEQHGSFQNCHTRGDFLNKLFGKFSETDIIQLFAEHIINNVPKIYRNDYGPLWNLFHAEIMFHREASFANELNRVRASNSAVQVANQELLETLNAEKKALCRKHMIPYDEPPPTVVPVPSGRTFG